VHTHSRPVEGRSPSHEHTRSGGRLEKSVGSRTWGSRVHTTHVSLFTDNQRVHEHPRHVVLFKMNPFRLRVNRSRSENVVGSRTQTPLFTPHAFLCSQIKECMSIRDPWKRASEAIRLHEAHLAVGSGAQAVRVRTAIAFRYGYCNRRAQRRHKQRRRKQRTTSRVDNRSQRLSQCATVPNGYPVTLSL